MPDPMAMKRITQTIGVLVRRITLTLIVVAVVVGMNDLGRYMTAQYDLSNTTENAAVAAADTARRTGNVNQAYSAATAIASPEGVEIYGYAHEPQGQPERVHLWTRTPVDGTLLLARYQAWRKKQPKGTAYFVLDEGISPLSN